MVRQTDPGAFGEQPAPPAETTLSAEELAAYDQHLQHELENVNEQRVQLGGEDPEQRQASDQQTLAQLDERAGQLSELRDLIADEFAERQQAEGTLHRSGADQRRSEQRELASAELRTVDRRRRSARSRSGRLSPARCSMTASSGASICANVCNRRGSRTRRSRRACSPTPARGLPAVEAAAAQGTGPRARFATRNPEPKRRLPTLPRSSVPASR
jgi:hypothetical protein